MFCFYFLHRLRDSTGWEIDACRVDEAYVWSAVKLEDVVGL